MAGKAGKSKGKVGGLKGLWGKARETAKNDGDFVPVDPGTYLMQLVSAEIGTYGSDRKLWLRWCVIDDDDNGGAICNDFMSIETEDKLRWGARLMMALGVEIGNRVQWKDSRKKLRTGTIAGWDKDDNAEVKADDTGKTMSVDPEKLEETKVEAPAEEKAPAKASKKKGKKKSKSSKKKEEPAEESPFVVGAKVNVEDEGKDWAGEITSVPDGEGDVQVTFDELPDEPEMVSRDRVKFDGAEAEPEAEAEAEGISVGDRVLVKVGNKSKAGKGTEVDAEDETADVLLDGKKKKTVTASFDDIDFEVDGE